AEQVGEAAEVETRRRKAAAAQAVVAVAVVELARLRLREHLVRLDDLPEALLRVRLVRDIRVQRAREPAERLLDLGLVRRPGGAEKLVVVAPTRRHPWLSVAPWLVGRARRHGAEALGPRWTPRCCVLGRARSLRLRALPASLPRNDHRVPRACTVPPIPPSC